MLKTLKITALAITIASTSLPAFAVDNPPHIPAPADATPVMVVIEARAKDPDAFRAYLQTSEVIPVTRLASGIHYSWSTQDQSNPERFFIIQSWNSVEQQQGYIQWREKSGALAEFVGMLKEQPQVTYVDAFDTATLPAAASTQ